MKTIAKIILSLLMMVQMSSLSFADADPANPAKTQKPCGFPDNMNCFRTKRLLMQRKSTPILRHCLIGLTISIQLMAKLVLEQLLKIIFFI